MRRRLAALLSLLTLVGSLLVWLVAVPIVSAGDPCYHGISMPPETTASSAHVSLLPCAFSPTVTQVDVGETVTFTNGTDFTHLVTGANQAWGSRDIELQPGATTSYTFDTAGAYPYACALHRGMAGVILVGDTAPAAAAVAGSGTTGSAPTANAAEPAAPPDARLVLAGLLAGALLGGLLVWFISRRGSAHGTESAGGVARRV